MKDREQASLRFRLQTESSRERDVFHNLHPWTHEYRCAALHRNAFPGGASGEGSDPVGIEEVEGCPDTALIAFAQLVCHRLAARRCFVSLISSSTEYTLAEASRTTSLQYNTVDDARDKPWLGTCSFLREEGLASIALDSWRRARSGREEPTEDDFYYSEGASPHWHIISDVRGSEYAHRGFARCSPHPVRFYAAIPLRSATGCVLGTLCIVDDAPRIGLSAAQLTFLEDISDTLVQHLNSVVVRSQRQRSERLIQSLGLFNSGKSSLRQWWLKQEDARIATAGRHAKQRTSRQRKDAGVAEFGAQASSSSSAGASGQANHDEVASGSDSDSEMDRGSGDPVTSSAATLRNAVAGVSRKQAQTSTQDFAQNRDTPIRPVSKLLLEPTGRYQKRRKLTSEVPDDPDFDLETASRKTYSRASGLLREALGADGVVFLNANAVHAKRGAEPGPIGLPHESSGASSQTQPSISDNDTSEGSTSNGDQHCMIEAFSTKDASSLRDPDSAYRFDISESFLSSLIRRYPHGKIFNFTRDGTCYSSSGDEKATPGSNSESNIKHVRIPKDGRRLGNVMVGATSIAFYPLWSELQERWCSGMFVWCTTPLRHFDPAEDVTYLASWGHSILAELSRLQTMASDKAKDSFIASVSHELRSPLHGILAGVEFLEETELTRFQSEMAYTIQTAGKALLDTVNNILDHAKMSSFTRAATRRRITTDASQNTKLKSRADSSEVGVSATVNLATLTEQIVETVVNAHRFQKTRMAGSEIPSVSINIEQRSNWMVRFQPGSWTRILNNLVGNALKYTPTGLIAVRLVSGEATQEGGEKSDQIRLTVQDTGIGMTKQFLSRELYTPFKQADSHASGTGLGLSIVRRICKDSGAQLKITSELGTGTCATVDFKAQFVTEAAVSSRRGLNVDRFHMFTPTTPAHFVPRSIAPSVMQAAQDWLDCEITQGPTCENASGSVVYAVAEEDLPAWVSQGAPHLKHAPSHVLVLGQTMRSVTFESPAQDLPFIPIFVHQPIGPQKLLRAITNDQSSTGMGLARPRPTREGSSLLEYEVAAAGRPLSMERPPAGYFPWDKPPHIGLKQNGSGPSTEHSASSSAVFSGSQLSIPHSASTERSNSIDSSAWHERTEESPSRDTVLLVEDNEVNLKLLMALMRKLDRKFLFAVNGRQAVDVHREHAASILLILMDISMPVMDGFAATVKIRETERRRKLAPCHIAALTGVTSEQAKHQAFTSGIDEFYSKPVGMREVKELLSKLQGHGGSK